MPSATPIDVAFGRLLVDDRISSKKYAAIAFAVAAGIIAFAVLCAFVDKKPTSSGKPASTMGGAVCFGVLGVGIAAFAVLMLIKGDRHTRIYEKGIVLTTEEGSRVLPFDDVEAFRCFIAYGKAAQIGFRFIARGTRDEDSGTMTWTGIRGPKMEQAEKLRIYLTKMFAARMLESLKAGDSVVWGRGQITPTGIQLDGRSIRWKEIARVKIRNNGSTVISCSGQGDVSLSIDAPNFWPGFAILKRHLDPSTFA